MELDFHSSAPSVSSIWKRFSLVTEPAVIRQEYLRQLHAFLSKLRAGCHEFNAEYRQAVTDQDYENPGRISGGARPTRTELSR